MSAQGISLVHNYIGSPFHYFLGSFSGSFAIICICAYIGRIPVVTFLGRESMIVLCVHGYVVNLVTLLLKKFPVDLMASSIIALILVTLSFYILVPFFRQYLPWAIGEN